MSETKTQRLYTIPLQAAWKVPYKRRAKKAVALIQKFVKRHMKAEPKNVRVGAALNDAVWARGIKFPPRKVKVQVVPQEIDVKGKKSTKVWVELEGVKLELEKKKKEAPKKKEEAKPEAPKAEEERKRGKTSDSRLSDDEERKRDNSRQPRLSDDEKKTEAKVEAPKTEEKKAPAKK
ncbi:50S ribosomal protein L31e [uncultured archaeon]|nr:50S ribosomal protein L31e [uncultured archaeon]